MGIRSRRIKIDRMTEPNIRLATAADLPAINGIYNHYIRGSTCTYDEEEFDDATRRAWFEAHGPRHPVTVFEENDEILGWAALSTFRARSGYRNTVENAVYVRHDRHGRGIGSSLLRDTILRAEALGHHTIIAVIDAEQAASVSLHRKFGFEQAALLRQVGVKFGRLLDVVYLQLLLPAGA